LKVSGTAPSVDQATNYTFYVKSTWTDRVSVTVQKPITIQVENVETTTAGTVAVTSTQTFLAIVVVFTLISSLISTNSISSIWAFVNQLQIITLLILIDSFTPKDLLDYLEGISFVNMNFDFIPFRDVPYVNWPTDQLDIELDDRKLNASGIHSRSTFVNLFTIIIVLLIAVLVHALLWLLPNEESRPGWKDYKLFRCFTIVMIKVLQFFKYAFYVRF
jgi:hypothetical protein